MMGAQITVGGVVLATRWDGLAVVAVDRLSFDWGRQNFYDPADPGVLRFRVIDRDGSWSTEVDRIGQVVTVERTNPGRVMFRGSIATARPKRVKVYNPQTRTREGVWIVDVTASSTVADLAGAVFTGPAGDNSVEGLGGWPEVYSTARVEDIMSAGASGIISSLGAVPVTTPYGNTRRYRSVAAKDAATALELIEGLYRAYPLGVVEYDPATNGVTLGSTAVASNVVLTFAGGKLALTIPTGRVVPATLVGAPNGLEAEATVADAIDAVQV